MAKRQVKEYKITMTLTDTKTGITKNVEDLTEEERKRAAVLINMRILKSYYGPHSTITLTNPDAEKLYGIKSL